MQSPAFGDGPPAMIACPCGSARLFDSCCGPLIAGQPAATAEALMRSRYTAYGCGTVDYLRKTSAGEALLNFDGDGIRASLSETEWLGLEIVGTENGRPEDDAGAVTFRARFRQEGRVHTLSERSEFRRIDGEWRYWRGDATARAAPEAPLRVERNDPCPCGSGKKFKKCHGG